MSDSKSSASVARRLRAGLIALTVLPVMLGFGVLQFQYVMHERGQVFDQKLARAEQVSQVVAHLIDQAEQELGLLQRLGVGGQERVLIDALHHKNMFNSLTYLDAQGREQIFVSRREVNVPGQYRWAQLDAVEQARLSGERRFGSVAVDPTSGEPSLTMVQPLLDLRTGSVKGLIVAELALKRANESLREMAAMRPGRSEDAFMVDQHQQVIAHVDPSRVLSRKNFKPVNVGIARDLDGRLAVVASRRLRLPGNELVAVVTVPLTVAFGLLYAQMAAATVILVLALLLAWWLQRRIERWILRPVQELTQVAQSITDGQTDLRAPANAGAEIGALGRSINAMLDRLVAQQAELEGRVVARTQDLELVKNQALEAGRMLQIVLDTIPVRIFWKDRDLVYLGCNKLFAVDAGCEQPSDVVGRTDYDLNWKEMAEQYRADDARVIRNGEPQLDYVEPQKTEDGKMLWLRTSKVPIRDARGSVIGVLGTYEDISQKKQSEDELRAAKEAAEAASRTKSLFLTSMSHELRTPLNAVLGYAQLMEIMPDAPKEVQSNAREIRHAGEMLLTLVNGILDLARAEAGRADVTMQTVALSSLLTACLAQNETLANNQRITLAADVACGGLFVTADERRLMQVLNHLVSNAIKYNQPNGRVDISCSRVRPGRIRIGVRDTGKGLTPQQKAQLFQPFNRLGAEMSSTHGTGVGLVLSRHLMEAMGGGIGVQSPPDGGSLFWIELQQAQIAQTPPSGSDTMHILVAEDYRPNQKILLRQLETLGYTADVHGNGAHALLAWREGRYDLLMTDVNMPSMDGLALTRAIRQEELAQGRKRMPVIGVTAAAEVDDVQKCLDAGMDEVLPKPIELQRLRETLKRWQLGADVNERGTPVAQGAVNTAVLDVEQVFWVLGQRSAAKARDLVQTFVDGAAESLAVMRANSDERTVAREMHKQKSSAKTVGAARYAALSESLERHIKDGDVGEVQEWLDKLDEALGQVREQIQYIGGSSALMRDTRPPWAQEGAPPDCRSVLLVDDDPVVLKQLSSLLQSIGVDQVLTASNGIAAIEVVSRFGESIDVLVSDLSMPSMDGVELIRRFGQTGFKGGVILMSGADMPILRTAHELAVMQGLRVLGEIRKPVLPQQLISMLMRMDQTPMPLRRAGRAPGITSQAIREAMLDDAFEVWFQPKVDAHNLSPQGMEALARWRREDGSFVSPDLFITLAERDGLIGELSQILMRKALEGAWQLSESGHGLKLAVNLSGSWLDNLNLPDLIMEMVQEARLKPADLVLEVTETGVMEDLTTALDVLTRLRLKGFGLSIDDFGIGYSSFEQIGRIPFTEMKLDRSFVNKGSRDVAARAILESSMGMAQKLGLLTVAEGVETESDLALVRELGCDSVQGYLIAKPMPLDDLLVWLDAAAARQ